MAAVGPGVTDWSEGDAVCALLPGGGYAEYVVTPAAHALSVPRDMPLSQAACLPETCYTVWSNVVMRGALKAGERFLVHGGSSGIGTTAIQLAHALGARVFATAGSDEKCAACADLGAERALNYRQTDFVEVLRAEGGADLILDMVGGSYIPRNIKALADDGRLVQIAFLQGPKVELNFAEVMMRRLTITGSTLRPQSDLAKLIGGIWIIIGSVLFFGAIVATITTYFMRPMQRPGKKIIDTIEYNLEQLDDLSIDELDLLKETVDTLIVHVEKLKEKQLKA